MYSNLFPVRSLPVKPTPSDEQAAPLADKDEDLGVYEEYLEKMKSGDILILDLSFPSLEFTQISQVRSINDKIWSEIIDRRYSMLLPSVIRYVRQLFTQYLVNKERTSECFAFILGAFSVADDVCQ